MRLGEFRMIDERDCAVRSREEIGLFSSMWDDQRGRNRLRAVNRKNSLSFFD
jgi:hypothetical protein